MNNIKNHRLSLSHITVLLLVAIGFMGCKQRELIKQTVPMPSVMVRSDAITHNPYSLPVFDQYFNIVRESDSDNKTLDSVPGMLNMLLSRLWVKHNDSIRFNMRLGISLDQEYPNETVRKVVFGKLNEYLAQGFDYDVRSEEQERILKMGADTTKDTKAFLTEWQSIFNKVSDLNGYEERDSTLVHIYGAGGGTVCHKIYEDDDKVTYLIESVIDYHASSGDPTNAEYITIDKATGKTLTVSDISGHYGRKRLEKLIEAAYKVYTERMGCFNAGYSGKKLLEKANGVAIIKEGILFYYFPYNIGSGSEGQFNLLIPADQTR